MTSGENGKVVPWEEGRTEKDAKLSSDRIIEQDANDVRNAMGKSLSFGMKDEL